MSETLSADAVLPKGEFAALIGVTPARISQYIQEGKIGPDALVGEGRSARVRVDLARRQINARRNVGQALGNGLMTRVDAEPLPAPTPEAPVPFTPRPDSVEEQLKRERLRGTQIANRKAAEEEEARKGRFVEASEVRQQMGRLASSILQTVEGGLPQMAAALAARFSIPQRDALHLLQTEFRTVRQSSADRHRASADVMPETVETVVATEGDVVP